MSTEAAVHTRNLESSILFMQQEHAATLKGLHEEISHLQKRCTDLMFQMTMQGLNISDSDNVDSKTEEMRQNLQLSQSKISSLEQEVAEKDKQIELLEAEARSQRKRWLDESRGQFQIMNSLRAELEAKANNIAYLTTELHRLKQKSKNSQTSTQETCPHATAHVSSPATAQVSHGVTSHAGYLLPNSLHPAKRSYAYHHYIPTPPRDKVTGTVPRFWKSSHGKPSPGITSPGKPVMAVHPPPNSASVAGMSNSFYLSSSHTSGPESPDITPFLLQPKEKTMQVVGVKQAPVLPPIPASSASSGSGSGLQQQHSMLVHQMISSASQHHLKKASPPKSEATIVTLAVKNAATTDAAWTSARESRSSEYN